MLLPYNVDRPTRLVPRFTYGLMGINVAIYLLTLLHANILLPGEKAAFRETEQRLEERAFGGEEDSEEFQPGQVPGGTGVTPGMSPGVVPAPGAPATAPTLEPPPMPGTQPAPSSSSDFSSLHFGSAGTFKYDYQLTRRAQMAPEYGTDTVAPPNQNVPTQATLDDPPAANGVTTEGGGASSEADKDLEALKALTSRSARNEKMKTKEGLYEVQNLMWRFEHKDDLFVLEPHPSALHLLAYHAGEPNLWSFLTSMFLHADLMHLLGNMLFLWVFGRATEDALGSVVFVASYLVCGYAATLLYHIMSVQFTPNSLMIPAMGASGAIAGVQGLFAPRFYRTPVRLIYTTWTGLRVFGPIAAILGFIFANVLELGTPGATLGYLCAFAALIFLGEDTLWRELRLAAMWLIGGWVAINDVIPALIAIAVKAEGGGVAHWAHIGGLLCGVAYAFLIGANKEGKAEYLIEDARRSLDNKYAGNAIEHAQKLVKEMPEKAEGYQLLAEAYDHKNDANNALDNYELAINKYIKSEERDQAMRLYTDVLQKHPLFILQPKTQFAIANQMAVRGHFDKAAENWAKIPFTFPDAPEGEQALLRAGQIYVERLGQTEMGVHLLNTLLERNPHTPLMPQVKTILHRAQTPTINLDAPLQTAAVAQAAKPAQNPVPEQAAQVSAPQKAAESAPKTVPAEKPPVAKPVAAPKPPVAAATVAPATPVMPSAPKTEALSQPEFQSIAFDAVTQEADLDLDALPTQTLSPQPATPKSAPTKIDNAKKVEESPGDDLLSMPMNFSKTGE